MPPNEKLVLFSKLAFYPMHWEAFRFICIHYQVQGTVIADVPPNLPSVHQQLGWIDPAQAAQDGFAPDIHLMPIGNRLAKMAWLYRQLQQIDPDAIWIQEEPTDPYLLAMLGRYFFNRRPRIVTAVCENTFAPGPWYQRLLRRWLWSRLDGLLAVATSSLEGIRTAGMPVGVPALTLVAGAIAPPDAVEPMPLPFIRYEADFVIGFVGRICEEKGWKVLLTALKLLSPSFKCLMAGDGPQVAELQEWLADPDLQGRVFYLGLLPKANLWRFYRVLNCLVLPSLTLGHWKEQFGGVLADGMAMGIPLVGSDSGAIPEVIGPAGRVVPENNSSVLADTLRQLQTDYAVRQSLENIGKHRFETEFSIPAYAAKIARGLQLNSRE